MTPRSITKAGGYLRPADRPASLDTPPITKIDGYLRPSSILDMAPVWALDARTYSGSGNWLDLSGNGLNAVPAGAVWWDGTELFAPIAVANALNAFTCPDAADLDLTSGFCIALDVWPTDWTPTDNAEFMARPTTADPEVTADCYAAGLGSDGHPFIEWNDAVDGHKGPAFITGNGATVEIDFTGDTDRKQLVYEFIGDNGAGGWTARLYSGVPGATTLLSEMVNTTDGAQTLTGGAQGLKIGYPLAGKFYRARLYASLGGTLLRDFYPERDFVVGATMTSGTGEVWSNLPLLSRRAGWVVGTAGWVVGTDATLTVADDPLLDIDASTSATIFALCSTNDPTGADFEPIVSKAPAGTGWMFALYNAFGGAVGGAFVAGSPTIDAGPAPSAGVFTIATRLDRDTDLIETAVDGVLPGSPADASAVGDLSNAGAVTIGGLPMASAYPKSLIVHAVGKINRALTDTEIAELPTLLGV